MSGSESETRAKVADLAPRELGERGRAVGREIEVRGRDRVAVRVELRVAELLGDPALELLRDVVLEHLGLVVDSIPRHLERLGEEGLDQAVVADDLEGDALTGRGQGDAVVRLVADQTELVKRLSIAVTDEGATSSRSASAEVVIGPSPWSSSA